MASIETDLAHQSREQASRGWSGSASSRLHHFLAGPVFGGLLWLTLFGQAAVAYVVMRPWVTGDSHVYLGIAKGLEDACFGQLVAGACSPSALRPPGYPILLWFLLEVLRLAPGAIIALQLSAYLLTLALADRFLRQRGFNGPLFKMLAASYPVPMFYAAQLMSEAWCMLLLMGGVLALATFRRTNRSALVAGAIAGALALFRTDLLPLPLLFVLLQFWIAAAQTSLRAAWKPAAITACGATVLLLPYSAWNYENFGRIVPAPPAAASGTSLYLATWQESLSQGDFLTLYNGQPNERLLNSGLIGEFGTVNRAIGAPASTIPFNPAAYEGPDLQSRANRQFGGKAFERISQRPCLYAAHVARNFWALWNTGEYPSSLPRFAALALMFASGLVYLLGMLGVLLAFTGRLKLPAAKPLAVIVLYFTLVHLPFHTEARYTAAARPLLLMFAAATAITLWRSCWTARELRSGQAQDGVEAS